MKKKILFVINTLGHAGAEMAMLELMSHFDPKKYEISLYVILAQGELIHRVPAYVKRWNPNYSDTSVLSKEGYQTMLRTVVLAFFKRAYGIRQMPYMIKNAIIMRQTHNMHKEKLLWRMLSDAALRIEDTFDLAIAYLEGGATYYVADHVKAKKKVAFVHIDYEQSGYNRSLDQDCYRSFDRICVVSEEVKTQFLKQYPECFDQTRVFHNFVDVKKIKKKSYERAAEMEEYAGIKILTVGRLTTQKAYEVAIDAMEILKQMGFNMRWYIVGEGPERLILERKILQKGLSKDFVLLGAKKNPYPYFRAADIYVHATRYEGKSIAIQEAQVLGCAIIASDANGNREQIQSGVDGILCELEPTAIAREIIRLVEDEKFRGELAKASREKKINHPEDMELIYQLLS
ncbi:MAG: hypothetical protein PWP24_1947 [Clostridiales bacterium]|nr:hypothetical protein [Clostridiales bacterium]